MPNCNALQNLFELKMKEPTLDECSNKALVYKDDYHIGYACWFPQMGGYAGRCLAVFDRQWNLYNNGTAEGGCIELYIWHDGEFPFSDEDDEPKHIHICDPEQFIILGKFLVEINNKFCKMIH